MDEVLGIVLLELEKPRMLKLVGYRADVGNYDCHVVGACKVG